MDDKPIVPVTGVILSGGQGRRMGGQDKGLLEINGRPMIEYVMDALSPQVDELIISANRNIPTYKKYGYPVFPDTQPDFQGPLAGILTGLINAKNNYVQFISCDSPLIPADLVHRMMHTLAVTSAIVCVTSDGYHSYPVCSLMHVSVKDSLQTVIGSGNRKVKEWISTCQHATTEFTGNRDAFTNINTPQDMRNYIAGKK